ncbi:unnamed protein product [Rotaria sp. Silwood1]|nr:unnamed protein product [Rotaria sp. Silwood1]CAF4699994.1 unnamed protein product [Rotaria sp. Silwood1]
MNHYQDNPKARNIIDNIQTKYACCGDNIWLDWARLSLDGKPSNIDETETTDEQSATTSFSSDLTSKSSVVDTSMFPTLSHTSEIQTTEATVNTELETSTSSAVKTGIDFLAN